MSCSHFKDVVLSFTVEGIDGMLKSPKDRAKFPEHCDLQGVVVTKSCKFRHTNGCLPNYQQ